MLVQPAWSNVPTTKLESPASRGRSVVLVQFLSGSWIRGTCEAVCHGTEKQCSDPGCKQLGARSLVIFMGFQ